MRSDDDNDNDEVVAEMNQSLSVLMAVFPRILPEVFREMLCTFQGESRLHLVIQQLLQHQDKWVRGRWRMPLKTMKDPGSSETQFNTEDYFRRASYKRAAIKLLLDEFKVLRRSKIEAVLVEENFCYLRTRSTLERLASTSWTSTFCSLFSKWRKTTEPLPKDQYLLFCTKRKDGKMNDAGPTLRETGDAELDLELYEKIFQPFMEKTTKEGEEQDWSFALAMNEAEAKLANALYECECCYSDTPFEQMATCTTEGHVICFQCIRRAITEALFGQSWDCNLDHAQGQIKCLAPTPRRSCNGCISQTIAQRAILQSNGGQELWSRLESRLSKEALLKARVPLVCCPFCMYAEVDELYLPASGLQYKLNTKHIKRTLTLVLSTLILLPLFLLYVPLSHLRFWQKLPRLSEMASSSLNHLSRSRHFSRRFQCRSPACSLPSCLICLRIWYDPHICYESSTLSLRITVEAARTAALKRACPRCGIGFIKDSGCNKLTCICGYVMCYVCRQGLGCGKQSEAYRHFCQHFRPSAGPCHECKKCDLYQKIDDESTVERAGIMAEEDWRQRQGLRGVVSVGGSQHDTAWWKKQWTIQSVLDWCIMETLTC